MNTRAEATPNFRAHAPVGRDVVAVSGLTISLQELMRINEDIKAVVELSRCISLGAANAGLISNKCDSASTARGFVVAARELGKFSRELEEVMHSMEVEVFREVAAAAMLCKLVNKRNALAATENRSGGGVLLEQLAQMDEAILLGRYAQGEWRKRMGLLLRRAEQVGKTGHVTGRVARLEAVGGGAQARAMTVAAEAIETQVQHTLGIVKKIFLQVV